MPSASCRVRWHRSAHNLAKPWLSNLLQRGSSSLSKHSLAVFPMLDQRKPALSVSDTFSYQDITFTAKIYQI
jgi:hypothetical protein